jgi:hypothetical protein
MRSYVTYTLIFSSLFLLGIHAYAKEKRGDDLIVTFAPSVYGVPQGGFWAMISTHKIPTLVEVPVKPRTDCKGVNIWECWFTGNLSPTTVSNQRWVFLGRASPEFVKAADVDGDGRDEIVVNYLTKALPGTYIIKDIATGHPRWVTLLNYAANVVPVDLDGNGRDDLIPLSYKESRLRVRMDNGKWIIIAPGITLLLDKANLDKNVKDDLIATFPKKAGLFIKVNNQSWVKIHSVTAKNFYHADIDGDGKDNIVADFGKGYGVQVRDAKGRWIKIDNRSPIHIEPADLDGNGRDDLIFNYGARTYARMDNGKWTYLLNGRTRILVAGDVDRNGKDDFVFSWSNPSTNVKAPSTWAFMNNRQTANIASAEAMSILGGTPIACPGGSQTIISLCGFEQRPGFSRQTYTFANVDGR